MKQFRVTLILPNDRRETLLVGADEHILEKALEAGIDLPHSCLQGWCLSCAAQVISGRTDQKDSRRYYEVDREEGFVLPCTGKPKTDLVLKTHATDAMKKARKKHHLPYPRGTWGK